MGGVKHVDKEIRERQIKQKGNEHRDDRNKDKRAVQILKARHPLHDAFHKNMATT